MKTLKYLSNPYLKGSLLVVGGVLLGWLLFHRSAPIESEQTSNVQTHNEAEHAIWTCAMHPQIKMDKPGDCPICGMELIPLKTSNAEIDDQAIEMSESAMKLAEVQISMVAKGVSSKDVSLYGKIQVNERMAQSQTAHVSGRIEQLKVNSLGEAVRKGQLLALIYSPELVSAQKELLEAVSMKDKYPNLLEAAKEKLRNLKLSDKQINDIEKNSTTITSFPIYANTTGVVVNKKVSEGDYVSKGGVLFDVVDLSRVWGVFDAYESDLAWISLNQQVEFTTQSIPGKTFSGTISFIDPIIDATTRITKVRVELNNADQNLKPEMFINGIVHSKIGNGEQNIVIPRSAVLWTGKRSVVYVKLPNTEIPTFKMRVILLGASLVDSYVIEDGLHQGDEVVTNGAFIVDAAAQLEGKASMMNQEGAKVDDGHNHGEMEMTDKGSDKKESANTSSNSLKTETTKMAMLKVSGNCEMCKDRIETAAKSVVGVESIDWNADKQMAHLMYNPTKTTVDEVQKAIAKVGHDTGKFKAHDSVYNALAACCLYRE